MWISFAKNAPDLWVLELPLGWQFHALAEVSQQSKSLHPSFERMPHLKSDDPQAVDVNLQISGKITTASAAGAPNDTRVVIATVSSTDKGIGHSQPFRRTLPSPEKPRG